MIINLCVLCVSGSEYNGSISLFHTVVLEAPSVSYNRKGWVRGDGGGGMLLENVNIHARQLCGSECEIVNARSGQCTIRADMLTG